MIASQTKSIYLKDELRRPHVWGFACYRLWIYLLFFSELLLPQQASSAYNSSWLLHQGSIVVLVLALLFFGINYKWTGLDRRYFRYFGSALACVGTAIVPLSSSLPIVVVSAITTGIGSALLLLDLGLSFIGLGVKQATLDISLGFLIAALLFPLFCLLPLPLPPVATPLLPLAASLLLHSSRKSTADEGHRSPSRQMQDPGANDDHRAGEIRPSVLVKLVISGATFSIVVGIMSEMNAPLELITTSLGYLDSFTLSSIAAPLIMSVFALVFKNIRLSVIYRMVSLFLVIGLLIILLSGMENVVSHLGISIGYTLFEMLVWVILLEMSNHYKYSPIRVFGLGNALMRGIGLLIGVALMQLMLNTNIFETPPYLEAAVLLVIALVITYLFIFNERDFEALITPTDNTNARSTKIPLRKKCEIVGQYYGLSAREIDVFHLLAQGRNAERIREELYISKGTINTHLRNIYPKLGVHSHQEVIDLLRDANLEELVNPKSSTE